MDDHNGCAFKPASSRIAWPATASRVGTEVRRVQGSALARNLALRADPVDARGLVGPGQLDDLHAQIPVRLVTGSDEVRMARRQGLGAAVGLAHGDAALEDVPPVRLLAGPVGQACEHLLGAQPGAPPPDEDASARLLFVRRTRPAPSSVVVSANEELRVAQPSLTRLTDERRNRSHDC